MIATVSKMMGVEGEEIVALWMQPRDTITQWFKQVKFNINHYYTMIKEWLKAIRKLNVLPREYTGRT